MRRGLGVVFVLAAVLGCTAADDPAAPDTQVIADTSTADSDAESLPDTTQQPPDTALPTPRDPCQAAGAGHCMMPFPSDHYRIDGGLDFTDATLFGDIDPVGFGGRDGYSTVTPLVFYFDGGTLTGTASVLDIERSLQPDSPTRVVDTVTGEPVAHWVELDHFTVDQEKPVYTVRFPAPLQFERRYVVGVRGLVDDQGALVQPTDFFVTQRQNTDFFDRVLSQLAPDFDVAETQLAWDFTTASSQSATTQLLAVRDAVLEAAGPLGAPLTVEAVIDYDDDPHIARRLEVIADVPSVLLPADDAGVRRLRLDADGAPIVEGVEATPVDIWIPHSVMATDGPVPVMQYGHGLFGSRKEAENQWLRAMANRLGFIVVAADMQGMSETDIGVWGTVLTLDVTLFGGLVEQPFQGFCNHLAIARAMKTFSHEGIVADPQQIRYYGNSQGGTIGSLLMSLQQDLDRGVLGVPGGAYAFLLNRSTGFSQFAGILKIPFPDPLAFSVVFTMLQTAIDPMDPLAYVHLTAPKQVLLQVAKEDSQVQNDVSFLLGRALGAKLMVPTPRDLFGFETQAYPYQGSAVVEYDFGKPDNPHPTQPPPEEHDTHGDLRVLEAAQDQLWHFLQTGEVISVCDGPCDPL